MRRPLKITLACLLLIAFGAIALSVLPHLQRYEESIDHGPSPEAQANEYLAAEMFLRQQHIKTRRADGLDMLNTLPASGQTLMLFAPRHNMTPRQSRQVLDWASRGGHLIFVAEELWNEEDGRSGDLLLDALGVQQYSSDDASRSKEGEALDGGEKDRYPNLTKIYLENEQAPAYAGFDPHYHLLDSENRAYAWANSHNATHMLQMEHGQGLITVLTDAWLWQNRSIASYDNAWLLWYLAQDSSVTLVYNTEHDNLFSLLPKHYPAALSALALLLSLLLWHVGMRHGPILPTAAPARRSLQEHLHASADFLLRHAGQKSLLSRLQQDILRRARQRHPGFERLAVAEQWHVLSRLTRLPGSAISTAMRPHPSQRLSASEFTRQVANLQTLRNAL